MKPKLIALIIGLAMAAGLAQLAFAQSGSIAVVVNTQNPLSTVSVGELRKVFVGEKRYWSGGNGVKLFTRMPGSAEHDALLKLVGMSETEYKQYWTSRIYQGEAQGAPIALPSAGMQREAITTYAGAIALVDAADVKPGMKVLKVEGKMPGEEGYPLQR